MKSIYLLITFFLLLIFFSCKSQFDLETEQIWPEIRMENKPGTYWWWMGSAVDEKNITYNLENLHGAGIGGVTIVPIYGVKGEEARFINYLSPGWMEMLAHTIDEANRLGMWVDMTTGTGWPFGGEHVLARDAAKKIGFAEINPADHTALNALITASGRFTIIALSENGKSIDITNQLNQNNHLTWQPPSAGWQVFFVGQEGTGQLVKRAAPGNHGLVLDPFSLTALDHYLQRFNEAFRNFPGSPPRAHYHDSYEYYAANWTDDFLEQFKTLRGYDLAGYIPQLFNKGDQTIISRIKSDYRETLAGLHLAYIGKWVEWAHEKGSRTRNQAHGVPANLLDLYAAADIPETEIFGSASFKIKGLRRDPAEIRQEDPNPLVLQFSSSAAHVAGKPLVASETCTWLREHFKTALSQVKPEIDQLFISGINHIFYHGNAYTPADAVWPGWLFYASTHFEKENSIWYDFPALNAYVARCQSILQAGRPDQDILLYWPVYDLWSDPEGLEKKLTVHEIEWFTETNVGHLAARLRNEGYSFDYLSDRQVGLASVSGSLIELPGGKYKTILVPACKNMPLTTWEKLIALAAEGATILFHDSLPADVPGFYQFEKRRQALQESKGQLVFEQDVNKAIKQAMVGSGQVLLGDNPEELLARVAVSPEVMTRRGVKFIRRQSEYGHDYFLVNLTEEAVNEWIPLAVKATAAVMLDPLTGKSGQAVTKRENEQLSVYLQLASGQSCILRTFDRREVKGESWPIIGQEIKTMLLNGEWQIEFIKGGPVLPQSFKTDNLKSWTTFPDLECRRFAGTARYTLVFELNDLKGSEWILDLGDVRESARVKVNGKQVTTLWSFPFNFPIGQYLRNGENKLELEVTNLSANRIADLDRRGVDWKKFYDINFVNLNYKKFDASSWPLVESGLIGPVKLMAVTEKKFP